MAATQRHVGDGKGAAVSVESSTECRGVRCVERTVTTTDGVRLGVRDHWSGGAVDHTVVLLHGFCLSQSTWNAQVAQLLRRWGDGVRVITFDHRGHGRSAGAPMRSYRIDRLAADLAEVLTALKVVGPLTVGGHSMGGMTALAYLGRPASDRPVDPDDLILVATAAGKLAERGIGRLLATPALGVFAELVHRLRPARVDETVRALVGPLCAALTKYGGYSGAEREALAAVLAAGLKSTPLTTAVGFLPGLRSYDQYHTLGAIAASTIVISGGADLITPDCHAHDLVAGIAGAVHVHRPDAGHMMLHDAPRVVTSAINRAIARHCRAVAPAVGRAGLGHAC